MTIGGTPGRRLHGTTIAVKMAMRCPIQITFHGMERSEAIDHKIRERLEKVERLSPNITKCRVVVEAPHKIHLNIWLPRTMLSVSKGELKDGEHMDLSAVLRRTFDAAERALREFGSVAYPKRPSM